MKSIHESEDLQAIRAQIRRFVEEKVVPNADPWEETGLVPREVLLEMGKIGFFGLRAPERFGGLGMGELASVVLAEEMGRSTFGGFGATVLVHTDLAQPYLLNYGTPEQQDKWFPGMMSGEILGALAITEPDAGSDVAAIRTSAKRDGDGFRLNGTKMFISNGGTADLLFVATRTNQEAKASRGITMFAVESDRAGFSASRHLDKLGWRSSNTAELVFDDCWVPEDNVIGGLDRGFYAIMNNFQNERLILGAAALGEAVKGIELTLDYVKQRKAFGSSLWTKQAIRQRLAMLSAEVEAARHLVYHAGWMRDQGLDAVSEVSMVKAFVGELVNRVMYDCVQFHGGMGYVRESPIERMFRDARIHSIGGGATEVMLEEIAKRL